jgi:hypothetical protein
MPSRELRQRLVRVLESLPLPDGRYAAFGLIALLTLLMLLAHYLQLSVAPLVVLACFLAVALLTGGLVVLVLAQPSGRGPR